GDRRRGGGVVDDDVVAGDGERTAAGERPGEGSREFELAGQVQGARPGVDGAGPGGEVGRGHGLAEAVEIEGGRAADRQDVRIIDDFVRAERNRARPDDGDLRDARARGALIGRT